MTEIKNSKWLNGEVQISLVSDRVQDDSKENKILKLKNRPKKVIAEKNNGFEDCINLEKEDNPLFSTTKENQPKKVVLELRPEYSIPKKNTVNSALQELNYNSSTTKEKQPKKVVLELRPEYSIPKKKTVNSALQELNYNSTMMPKRPRKVILEQRQEPDNNVRKTTFALSYPPVPPAMKIPSTMLVSNREETSSADSTIIVIDSDDDSSEPDPLIDSGKKDASDKRHIVVDGIHFLVPWVSDEEESSYPRHSIEGNSISKDDSISSSEDESVVYSKDNPYSCCGYLFCTPIEVRLHKTTHIPYKSKNNGGGGVNETPPAARNKSYDKELKSTRDLATGQKRRKRNIFCGRRTPWSSSSAFVDLTMDENDNEKTKPDHNGTRLSSHSDSVADKNESQRNSSGLASAIINSISGKIINERNKIVHFKNNSLSLILAESKKQNISSPQSTQQLSTCDSVHSTATNSNNCDAIETSDRFETQQLSISESASVDIGNKSSDQQEESSHCNTQTLSVPTLNLIHNEHGDKNKSSEHNPNIIINGNCDALETSSRFETQQPCVSESADTDASNTIVVNQEYEANHNNTQDLINASLSAFEAINYLYRTFNDEDYEETEETEEYNIQKPWTSCANGLVLDKCDNKNTHQLQVSDVMENSNDSNVVTVQKLDRQTRSQEVLASTSTDLDENNVSDEQNKFDNLNSYKLAFKENLIVRFHRNSSTPKNNMHTPCELKKRTRVHDPNKEYICTFCERTFSVKSELKAHLKSHSIKKGYKCDICKQTFKSYSSFVFHVPTHTGYKPFKCTKCIPKVAFTRKSDFLFHQRSHTDQYFNGCHVCFKTFKYESCLKNHLFMHSKKISFQCSICKTNFGKKSSLIFHIRTHNKEKKNRRL